MGKTTKESALQSYFVFVQDNNTGKILRMAFPSQVQIGVNTLPADLIVTGTTKLHGRLTLSIATFTAVNKKVTYNINTSDIITQVIGTNATETINLYLPKNPIDGQIHIIKDMSGTASTKNIQIYASKTTPITKIDGADYKTINTDYGKLGVFWYANMWNIFIFSESGSASLTDTAPVDVTKSAATVGVATDAARADHKHNISTAVASSLSVGGASSEGSATSLCRSDHTHALPAFGTTAGTFCQGNDSRFVGAYSSTPSALGVTGATDGASSNYAKGDHAHNINVAAPSSVDASTTAVAAGASTSLARADHTHTFRIPSQAAGDFLYATSASAWARLPIGAEGRVLSVVGGVPAYAVAFTSASSLGGDVGGTPATTAVKKLTGDSEYVTFPAAHTSPRIGQEQAVAGSGYNIRYSAQSGTASGVTNGGMAVLSGGGKNSTGTKGGVQISLGVTDSTTEPMIEVAEKVTGNSVVALNYAASLTTTEAPAGVGDAVILVANARSVPSANPGPGGVTVYLEENVGLWVRDGDGNEIMIAPVVTS